MLSYRFEDASAYRRFADWTIKPGVVQNIFSLLLSSAQFPTSCCDIRPSGVMSSKRMQARRVTDDGNNAPHSAPPENKKMQTAQLYARPVSAPERESFLVTMNICIAVKITRRRHLPN